MARIDSVMMVTSLENTLLNFENLSGLFLILKNEMTFKIPNAIKNASTISKAIELNIIPETAANKIANNEAKLKGSSGFQFFNSSISLRK
jgi:hypothetical protein